MNKQAAKRSSSSSSSSSDSSSSSSDSSSDSSSEEPEEKKKRKKAEGSRSKAGGGGGAPSVARSPGVGKIGKAAKAKAATKIQSTFRGQQARKKEKPKSTSPDRSGKRTPSAAVASKSSKVASPLVAGKKDQAAAKIQRLYRGSLLRSRAKSETTVRAKSKSPTGRRESLFSKVDLNGDGIVTRSDFKKALSAGVLDGLGMQDKMRSLQEETQKLRKMLAEVSSSPGGVTNASTTASSIPRLDFKALHHSPSGLQIAQGKGVAAKRPPRPNSAPKKWLASASKTPGSKKKGDEEVLQEWLMDHVETPEKRENLVKQFREWAVPSAKKKKLRPYGRSQSSSPPRKTSPGGKSNDQRNPRTPSPMKGQQERGNGQSTLKRSNSMEPHSSQKQATLQRSLSADGSTLAKKRANSADASRRGSPDGRKRKQAQESDWSDFSKSPRSESVERWTRWKKPHERETFEIVAEYGVIDIGFSTDALKDGSVVVTEVVFGSWAWRKGVEEKDQLLEVDDKKVSDLSEAQMRWAMMRRPVRLAFLSNLSRGERKRSASADTAKGKGKRKKKGKGKGKSKEEHVHTWGTDLAKATPRNWNKIMKGQAKRSDSELVHVTPDDVIRFAKSPLTSAMTSSFKIINRSETAVAFKVKTSAPKNYHMVQPTKGVLASKKVQAVRLVFKPRGMTDLLQPEYSIVIQIVSIKEDEGEGLEKFDELELNPMIDLAKNPVVEEHRLLVIFEDSNRCGPVDLSNTGIVSHEESSFACPSRMNVAHADTLEKREQYRQQKRQEMIDEFENTIKWPTKRAPSEELLKSAERLHGQHKRIHDRRAKSAQDAIEKEKKALTTIYNSSAIKFAEVGTERFDHIVRDFWRQKELHENERKKAEDEDFKKLQEKSVHANADVSRGQDGTDRLYQEGLDRMARKQDAVDKELERQEAETCICTAAPGTVNVDELLEKLLNDGKEDKQKIEKKRNEEFEKAKAEASRGDANPSAERQTQALRHAHSLSATWKKHERYRVLLAARYQEAETELIKQQSVGHEVPEDWASGGLLAMVERLYPHNDVRRLADTRDTRTDLEKGWNSHGAVNSPRRHPKNAAWKTSEDERMVAMNPDAFDMGSLAMPLENPLQMGALVDEGVAMALPGSHAKAHAKAQSKSSAQAKATAKAKTQQLTLSPRQVARDTENGSAGGSPRSPRNRKNQFEGWDYFGGDAKAQEMHTKRASNRTPVLGAEASSSSKRNSSRHQPTPISTGQATLQDEQNAATKIQALFRGRQARQEMSEIRACTDRSNKPSKKTSDRRHPSPSARRSNRNTSTPPDSPRSPRNRTPGSDASGTPVRMILQARASRAAHFMQDTRPTSPGSNVLVVPEPGWEVRSRSASDSSDEDMLEIKKRNAAIAIQKRARGMLQRQKTEEMKQTNPPKASHQARTSQRPVIPKLSLPSAEAKKAGKASKSKATTSKFS